MWWKIYFWVALALSVIGILIITSETPWGFGHLIDTIMSILTLLGLYSYVYKKNIFSPVFWKVYFWIGVFYSATSFIYYVTPLKDTLPLPFFLQSVAIKSAIDVILDLVFGAPAIYAIYKLGSMKDKSSGSKNSQSKRK